MKPKIQNKKTRYRTNVLESEKLKLEIRELNKKWYQKLSYGTIISAIFVLGTLSLTYFSGILDTESTLLEIRKEKLNDTIRIMENKVDSITNKFESLQNEYNETLSNLTHSNKIIDSISTANLNCEDLAEYYKRRAEKTELEKNKLLAAKNLNQPYLIERISKRRKVLDIEQYVNEKTIHVYVFYKFYSDSLNKYKDNLYSIKHQKLPVFASRSMDLLYENAIHDIILFIEDENISKYISSLQTQKVLISEHLCYLDPINNKISNQLMTNINNFIMTFNNLEKYLKDNNLIPQKFLRK